MENPPTNCKFQYRSSDFLYRLNVDGVAGDIHGSRHLDPLAFVWAGFLRIVQHIGKFTRAVAQNEVVSVLDYRPGERFGFLFGFLLHGTRQWGCTRYPRNHCKDKECAGHRKHDLFHLAPQIWFVAG